jgi:4-alpha-glucanotransferase
MFEEKKAALHWEKVGVRPHHGIAVPLASIWSRNSLGSGEILDLLLLIDLVKEVGMDLIQLLPIHDSGNEASPYHILSSHAIDPIYISLRQYGIKGDKGKGSFAERKRQKLELLESRLPPLEFEAPWIDDYLTLRPFGKKLQAAAFSQWARVKKYAEEKGVLLIGDLPFSVSQESVDRKLHPEFFRQEGGAGAPPDLYNPDGQDWNLPIPTFDRGWLKGRLDVYEKLFDLYRIDHVVGYFRTYCSKEKRFFPEKEEEQIAQGRAILSFLLESSELLPIAEDLGTIPFYVRQALKELGIPGMHLLYFGGEEEADSMTSVTTHDLPSIAPDDPAKRWETLKRAHRTKSLLHVNPIGEYFLEKVERINEPGVVSEKNWSYKLPKSLEELLEDRPLLERMREIKIL